MSSVLAKMTNGKNVAIVQIGSTLPSTSPPIRIAEEYAMLDCISGGRFVAGFPRGLSCDASISNGVIPVEQRERHREALELVVKAWQAKEIFAWNGKHYQLPMVNPWPRPIQQPHPPIWIPGSGISPTAEFCVDHDYCYCNLSYFGAKASQKNSDRYWEIAQRKGRDRNPYRYTFLQLVAVSETDAEADEYAAHAEYFFHNLLSTPEHYLNIPGTLDYQSLVTGLREKPPNSAGGLRALTYAEMVERGFVIAGSAKTVTEKLLAGMTRLNVGHLLALLHFGSMPTELCKKNIDRFTRDVLPHLEGLWDDEWEDRWWPERLRAPLPVTAVRS
jgi:alkanesulfonate monooxygenase SsuD/methylene tetrahydromethanopterin reductase-like flavin-dependent oxidoreductase (luciferase family)